jgi:hypothetical protein
VKFSAAEWEILTDANEDWYALSEALSGLRGLYPGLPESDLVAVAQEAFRSLIHKRLIYLCYANPRTRDEEVVSPQKAVDLLSQRQSWEPTDAEVFLSFVATPEGEKAWRQRD